jgi:peptidoglycan/LPS O-acetylase OafA/YrhL
LVVGLAASQAILWLRPEHIVLVGTWIVTSAMVVGGALSCEGQFEIVEIPMLVMTGDASYLIYLIHNPVLSFFRLQAWLWWPLQLAGALAACVCAAVGLLPVERFVVRFVRVRLRGLLEAASGVGAGASLAVIDHPAGGDGR